MSLHNIIESGHISHDYAQTFFDVIEKYFYTVIIVLSWSWSSMYLISFKCRTMFVFEHLVHMDFMSGQIWSGLQEEFLQISVH